MILILGISGGIGSGSRVVRSAVIGIKENVYSRLERRSGPRSGVLSPPRATQHRAAHHHLFSISIGSYILSAASLSFLGFGLPPDIPDWGGMLSREGASTWEADPRLALCRACA